MPGSPLLFAAVGLGAAIGSVARYLCGIGMHNLLGAGFAWGTLTVNVAGSFLIGLLAVSIGPGGRFETGPVARQFALTGLCGGFTTFSIFSLETLLLARQGSLALAGINVAVSVVLWLGGVWLGHRLGATLNAGRRRGI